VIVMHGSLRLWVRYVALSMRSQLEYRSSTIMLMLGNLLTTGVEFLAIWVLFDRFGRIRGFELAEVALLYGMTNISFALAEMLCRGFKVFDQQVKGGDFDRVLLRPRGTAFQVCAQHFDLARMGRMLQGVAVLGWAMASLGLVRLGPELVLLAGTIVGGACTFAGLFVLQATVAFWTVESLELFAIVTYGGLETAQYPLSIYTEGFRRFFTWVIPLAFLSYVPGLVIMGRPERFGPEWLAWVSPAFGVVFLLVCLRAWGFGVRHYRSTGS
jgi:ABC-2 type transport system permease protein